MTDFEQRVLPYRAELKALCYRMSGSIHDAEDLLQDALLKAYAGLPSFEGRSSMRTWLYRVTTNVCLSALEAKKARGLPQDRRPAGSPDEPMEPLEEPVWLTPAPHEEIGLAFLAALQLLPPRQRAIVILRDVLGWTAAECAELLEMSVPAVNSALQRAKETLGARRHDEPKPPDESIRELLQRYIRAWEQADLPALVALLREDATMAMPPIPVWLRGPGDIAASMRAMVFDAAKPGEFTFEFAAPVLAIRRDGKPFALQAIEVRDGKIAAITAFLDLSLFGAFGLA